MWCRFAICSILTPFHWLPSIRRENHKTLQGLKLTETSRDDKPLIWWLLWRNQVTPAASTVATRYQKDESLRENWHEVENVALSLTHPSPELASDIQWPKLTVGWAELSPSGFLRHVVVQDGNQLGNKQWAGKPNSFYCMSSILRFYRYNNTKSGKNQPTGPLKAFFLHLTSDSLLAICVSAQRATFNLSHLNGWQIPVTLLQILRQITFVCR